jgi:outer membrane beta-barrel protein
MNSGAMMNLGFERSERRWTLATTPLRMGLWVLGLLVVLNPVVPQHGHAQDMSFDIDETESTPAPKKGKAAESDEPAEEEASAEASGEGDVLTELSEGGIKDDEDDGSRLPREKEVAEEIYAVQRMYVLRNGRFELIPSFAQTVNDPYVSHPALSIGLNYWVTNVLAVGANFLWYQGLESESKLNFSVRRSTRLAVPITEYQLGAHLNFTYVPIYGKFEMFNDSIFQWDSYLLGGVGLLRTRPVAVIDPAVRAFDFDWRVAFNVGVGIRVFITKWLSAFGELRNYMYLERLENLQVSLSDREGENTWIDPNAQLTHNVTMHLGLTMFFPFTFEYRYPK